MSGADVFPFNMEGDNFPEQETTQKISGPVTIEQLEEKAAELRELHDRYDLLKIDMEKLNEKEEKIQRELMGLLEAAEITSYKSKSGLVVMSTLTSVAVPKDKGSKEQFFNYLKEKGIYDEVVNVNSKWLNSYYKKENESAAERGELFFSIPGIGQPFQKSRLSFRKVK